MPEHHRYGGTFFIIEDQTLLTEVLEQLYKLKIQAAAEADVQQGVVLQQAAE